MSENGVRAALVAMLKAKGKPVALEENSLGDVQPNYFSWVDWDADEHGRECGWHVSETAVIVERIYDQFDHTDGDGLRDYGVDVDGAWCSCWKYSGVRLRYSGTMGQMLTVMMKFDGR